jgi:DNA-binding response OmpR family regulator
MDGRALIIDPSARDVRDMRAVLEAAGFVVACTADPEDALATLESTPHDVVLLEVALPAADGMTVLDRIRASPQLASTPVIIVTTKTSDVDVLAGYKFGADYYLTKPVTPRRLLRAIGLVLGREIPE